MKLKVLFMLALLYALCGSVSAQVSPIPWLKPTFLDNSGNPCAGCLLYTYTAGTVVAQVTYSDALGVFPNSDPVILDSAGRAFVFTGPNAYKFVLTTSLGATLWTIDNITNTALSLLSSNNTWTGTNTYNGAVTTNSTVTFNLGFTSNGPSLLSAGGTLSGTFLGNPIFGGTPNFTGGITTTTLTLSGQLTSTVATGTPPFIIASTTQVANLNASLLLGCTWAAPCPIGTTTPNTGAFTALKTTNLQIGTSPVITGAVGTDVQVLTAGTVTGPAGTPLCTDSNQGATTAGCGIGASKIQIATFCASGCTVTGTPCTTANSSYSTCPNNIPFPTAFVDTNYGVSCVGVGPVDNSNPTPGRANLLVSSKNALSVNVLTVTLGSSSVLFTEIDCTGVHP